jgi:hypothetical protein
VEVTAHVCLVFVDVSLLSCPQVLMEAVFQECFEREITKAERNINNKARWSSCRTRLSFLADDSARDRARRSSGSTTSTSRRVVERWGTLG